MTTQAIEWSAPALEGLERFFRMRLAPEQLEGADPVELRADLQTHFEEEFTRAGLTTVTLADLQLVLGKMGESLPGSTETKDLPKPLPPAPIPVPMPEGRLRHPAWFLLFAVVMPLITFLFEIVTRGGAGMFFDPMPDVLHHLMVLTVPAAGLSFWMAHKPGPEWRLVRFLPWLLGAGLAFAGFYAICFLPVLPLSVVGVIFWGLGLLPLTPLIALAALWRARVLLKRAGGEAVQRGLKWGFRAGVGLLLVLEMPVLLTHVGIYQAKEARGDVEAMAAAGRFCRRFGTEDALLRGCYQQAYGWSSGGIKNGPAAWIAHWTGLSGTQSAAWASRDLFYRVTGKVFNGVPRPSAYRPILFTNFNSETNFQRDEARGGTTVAGRIDGLTLADGRMDWHCEEASGLTWGEWTLTFENTTGSPEEARCRIALPPGGFVSRVTLWVNGQPEEAAYSTVAKVQAAYQAVAVVQRRDPVLVTQPDAGSILVQAFPVPARGQLKTRITFTVPAGVDSRVWLPSIVERNFGLPDTASHPLWVQANHGTLTLPPEMRPHAAVEGGAPTVTGVLPLGGFTGNGSSFTWTHQAAPLVYTEDPFSTAETSRVVVRKAEAPAVFQPGAIAWVIDTSASLKDAAPTIPAAVAALAIPSQTVVFLPGDAPSELQILTDPGKLELSFAGGRDNTPALAAAVDWLRGRPDGCLIWLHGPQPISEASRSTLEQLLERSTAPFTLLDVAMVPGGNPLGAIFHAWPRVKVLPVRPAGPQLAASLRTAFQQPGGTFSTLPAGAPLPDGAVKSKDALARWYARSEASRLAANGDPAAASAIATAHQIVTPWSGAVVLEKASDYTKHGLQQASASVAQQIPVIPEPSGGLLVLMSAIPLLLRRRRSPHGISCPLPN